MLRGILVIACLMASGAALASSADRIAKVECIEYPGRDPGVWNALYAAEDGNVYTGLCTHSGSAHFYRYDPETGKNENLYDIAEFLSERRKGIRTSGKIHTPIVSDGKGGLYFGTLNAASGPHNVDYTSWKGGHWLRYDLESGTLSDLGLVAPGIGLYTIDIDPQRQLLFGLGFTGYFYRHDIRNGKTTNLGRVCNWDICRKTITDDLGNVYGCFPIGKIWKYDAKTEKINDLSVRIPYDPTIYPVQVERPMIDRTGDWRAVVWDPAERVIYGVTTGSGSILFRYDPFDGPQGKVTELGKLCAPRYMEGNQKAIPFSTLTLTINSKTQKIYFIASARTFQSGRYFETLNAPGNFHLIQFDLKTNERQDMGILQSKDGRRVFGCEAGTIARDGTLYFAGLVEVDDVSKATKTLDGIPSAMHLIKIKPR
jgi:hypothetical protein